MPSEFVHERRIEFHETDMAGLVHFSNYFRFMEACEHEFFRSLGWTLHTNEDGVMRGWVRVHAECDYASPLHYQDVLEIRLTVTDKTDKSFAYRFTFTRKGAGEVARGSMRVVCVSCGPGEERVRAVSMPAELSERIQVSAKEGA